MMVLSGCVGTDQVPTTSKPPATVSPTKTSTQVTTVTRSTSTSTVSRTPITLPQPGSIKIVSNTTGVAAVYDGKSIGKVGSDFTAKNITPGTSILKLSGSGLKDWTKYITVESGKTTTVYAYLEPGTGASASRSEQITPDTLYGEIGVKCDQASVAVFVDNEYGGIPHGDSTVTVPAGIHTLKLVKNGFNTWLKQVAVTPGTTTGVYAYLEPGDKQSTSRNEIVQPDSYYGELKIYCDQLSTIVYVGNEPGGTVNGSAVVGGLISGQYSVQLVKEGFKTWEKKISVVAGNTTVLYAYLEAGTGICTARGEQISPDSVFGSLHVYSNQSSTAVFIDGEPGGKVSSDGLVEGIVPGTYTLTLTKTGYKSWSKKVRVEPDRTTTVYAYLEAGAGESQTMAELITPDITFGSIKVTTFEPNVSVYIDSEPAGVVKESMIIEGLIPGEYTVIVTKTGFSDYKELVSVSSGQTTTVFAGLKK